MRSIAQMAEDVIAIRSNAKYAFMTPETVAIMLQTQQLERIADALVERNVPLTPITGPVLSQDQIVKALDAAAPVVGMEQAVANQRAAETSAPALTIPRFNPQPASKRK